MPLIRNPTAGASILASAKIARQFDLTIVQGTTSNPLLTELQVNTLPAQLFYAILTAGPAGCTFEPRFAVTNTVVAGVIRPDYQPVLPPQILFLNVPVVINAKMIANMITGVVTCPGGGANAAVTVILSASM